MHINIVDCQLISRRGGTRGTVFDRDCLCLQTTLESPMWVGRQIAISWFAVILIFVGSAADADDLLRFVGESQQALQEPSTPRDSELMTAVWNAIRTDGIVDPT